MKAVVMLILAYMFRLRGADKWLFALGLAQAGEFGFVLLSFTVANSVIPGDLADLLLLVVALSMLLTPASLHPLRPRDRPPLCQCGGAGGRRHAQNSKIIIAGAGRVGGIVERILTAAGHHATMIDFSSHRLEVMQRFGFKHYFGDATRPDLLAAAGIAEAKLSSWPSTTANRSRSW
jgi:CPA2 family monovalent cation:H+ antiporter-2